MSLEKHSEVVVRALQNNIQTLEDNIESVDEEVRPQWEAELAEYK